MLRSFRVADAAPMHRMISTYFPEEEALLRWRPSAFEAVVRRALRPDLRFLLWLLEKLRHPIVTVFALEVDGTFAGAAILSYPTRAGYISSVVIDAPYRHRGYATQIVRACEGAAARMGKRYAVLDVLRNNAPARALYVKMGYQPLRAQSYYLRDYAEPLAPTGAAVGGVRAFTRKDAEALVPIATALLPSTVAEVLPVHPRAFSSVPLVAAGLRSETEAWVVDTGHGPEGYIRSTSSAATESGHLTAPIFAPGVTQEEARACVQTAVGWLRERGIRRVVCEMAAANTPAIAALSAEGFHEAIALDTLYHTLAA